MLNKIERYIQQNRLLAPGGRYVVAISGGADSVALLLVMLRLGYHVEAAHCNFRLRGEESDRDERFVQQLCEQHHVPLHLAHFDTLTYAGLHKVSVEMAARELRYRYFGQLMNDVGADGVCVAHHSDDAVETVLMNLIRGTGIHGLTGIRPRRDFVLRPLLCVSRREIEAFLSETGQAWLTDSTNLVADVVRNRVRLQVLPLLRDINAAADANILQTASHLAEAECVYLSSVQSSLERLFTDGAMSIEALMKEPSPESVLFELVRRYGFNARQAEQIFASLDGVSGRVFASPSHELLIDRGRICVEPVSATLPEMRLPETGTYVYAGSWKLSLTITDGPQVSCDSHTATVDAEKVKFPLVVRPVQSGDRFVPFGMTGSRLVSDYLTDRKLSRFEKRRQLVVTDRDGQTVWLVGQRTDNRVRVTPDSARTLFISLTMA